MEEKLINKKKMLFAAWSCSNKNYFAYQTWYNPLKAIFKEVVIFDPQDTLYKYGKNRMNEMFLDIVDKEKPDFIFLWLIYDEFSLDTLKKIKKVSPKTKIINFFGDDDTLFENFSRYYSLFIDYPLASHKLYFTNYAKEGISNVFFSCGVNLRDFKYLKLKKKYDVSFIGTPKRDRVDLIKFLISKGIKIHIYGAGWEHYPEIKENYCGKLSKEDLVKVINESRINLSFTKNYLDIPSFKARVFEICACKSFLLSEYFVGYLDFLKNKEEIVMFKNNKDLLDKVNYYLKNEKEREKIANRAYKKVVNLYSQENEFKRIFSKIEELERKNRSEKELPKINDKVFYLDKEKIQLDKEKLLKVLENINYVGFIFKNVENNKEKDYFQIYSLQKSGKEISCCDYNIYNNILGEIASVQSRFAVNTLPLEKLSSILHPSQIVVKKEFFINNLDMFKKMYNLNNFNFINEKNCVFVSIPLVNIRKIINSDYDSFEKIFIHKLDIKIRELKNRKKLFSNYYIYLLIIYSAMFNPVIAKYLIKRFLRKKQVLKDYIKNK